ncbi:MAG: GMC family oxidoreductase [bacterium]|nr:GMC family oxidoreductase [bacterium]
MAITRRDFLVGTGAALASTAVGCNGTSTLAGEYDLCIIGSGFAGTYLGLRAVDSGLRTVIVEAGSRPRRGGSLESLEESFKFRSRGATSYPVNGTRAIAVGGASRHWGGVTTRLWPEDFRMKSEFGRLIDWPIAFDDLVSYYCESERLLLAKGYPTVTGAEPSRNCSYPQEKDGAYRDPGVRIEGKGVAYFPVAHSRRGGNYALKLLDEEIPSFVQSDLGTLIEDQQVTNIVTLDGETIDHVELRGLAGRSGKLHARAFVVAAGVVESARLLLASESSWFPNGLGNRHAQVGHYFNVHPSLQTKFDLRSDLDLPAGHHRTCSLNTEYRQEGINACQLQLDVLANGAARWKAQPEIEPNYESYVTLSKTLTDVNGVPLPELHFGYSEQDQRTLERNYLSLEAAKRELAAPGGNVKDHDRWRAHPAGTCRMSFDEETGVVDRDNRVFGLDNLYVSGACTFPTSGTANPTNTVVAMTLRLADHIQDRLA